MSAITPDDVAHLARLARLELAPDELASYAAQLDVIVASVARVSEVAADDVPPTSHPLPLVNVTRPDVARAGLSATEALSAAPAIEDDRFKVPRILDQD